MILWGRKWEEVTQLFPDPNGVQGLDPQKGDFSPTAARPGGGWSDHGTASGHPVRLFHP